MQHNSAAATQAAEAPKRETVDVSFRSGRGVFEVSIDFTDVTRSQLIAFAKPEIVRRLQVLARANKPIPKVVNPMKLTSDDETTQIQQLLARLRELGVADEILNALK